MLVWATQRPFPSVSLSGPRLIKRYQTVQYQFNVAQSFIAKALMMRHKPILRWLYHFGSLQIKQRLFVVAGQEVQRDQLLYNFRVVWISCISDLHEFQGFRELSLTFGNEAYGKKLLYSSATLMHSETVTEYHINHWKTAKISKLREPRENQLLRQQYQP